MDVGFVCGQVDSSSFVLGWARCLGGVCGSLVAEELCGFEAVDHS